MRELLVYFLLIPWLSSAFAGRQNLEGKVHFLPEKPEPESQIEIRYSPGTDEYAFGEEITGILYVNFDDEIPTANEIHLQKQGGGWSTRIQLGKGTKSVLLILFDSLGKVDNNLGKGYWTGMYRNGKLVPGALASIAEMYSSGWDPVRTYYVNRNPSVAKELYETDFAQHPEIKRRFTRYYLGAFNLKDHAEAAKYRAELDQYAALEDLSEWELLLDVSKYYAAIHEDVLAEKYKRAVFERFPTGSWAIQTKSLDMLKAVYMTNDINERRAIFARFKEQYPHFDDTFTARVMTNRRAQMLGCILELHQGDDIPAYWNDEVMHLPSEFRKYAYHNSGKKILGKGDRNVLAEKLARKSVEMQREYLSAPRTDIERVYWTDRKVATVREDGLARYLDLHGRSLLALDRTDEALSVLREACITYAKRKQAEINQSYVEALIQARKQQEAIAEMKLMVSSGNTTSRINELLASMEKNPDKIVDLKHQASKSLKRKLSGNMLFEKMEEQISFTDRLGNEVFLNDFAGKTVVIDCWASWCAPCIAGLPAMEKLAKRYAKGGETIFLFLNTQDKKGKDQALKIFGEGKATLNLLFDSKNMAGEKLHVNGLPTKIVIDKDQRIRFREAGTQGSEQQQADEVAAMIELVN